MRENSRFTMTDFLDGIWLADVAVAPQNLGKALKSTREVIEGYGRPVAGLRLQIVGRAEGEFQHVLSLVEQGQEHEGDTLVEAAGIPVYLEGRNRQYLASIGL